jgi:hypothetical protein
MKRIGIMIYPEILDALENLSTEEKGAILEMIIKWNKGEEVIPTNSLEKFVWATILPKLEDNKQKYQEISVKRTEAVKKRWDKQTDTNEYKSIQVNTNSSTNYNSSNNSSKEELLDKQQPSSLEGDEVVSKGLESLENIFPQGRNFIGIDEVNLWNSLTQQNKQVMIKRASMYIRNEKKKDDGKYIKGIGKWMREQVEKGFEESLPSIKTTAKSDDPRLLKNTDGTIYMMLLDKCNNSTGKADRLYSYLNKKESFSTREAFVKYVKEMDKDEINTILYQ